MNYSSDLEVTCPPDIVNSTNSFMNQKKIIFRIRQAELVIRNS